MRTHDGYIPRAIKDLCNEINRVKGVVANSLQFGEQQKAMLADALSVIMDKVPPLVDESDEVRVLGAGKTEDAVRETVFARVLAIIGETAWVTDGRPAIEAENFENLQIAITDFLVPLLRKAGWFVDEDDGLLTCGGVKENHVEIKRRSPDEVQEQFMLKTAEFQMQRSVLLEKLQLARRSLTTMCDPDELLTPTGFREHARVTLDKLNGNSGQQEVEE